MSKNKFLISNLVIRGPNKIVKNVKVPEEPPNDNSLSVVVLDVEILK